MKDLTGVEFIHIHCKADLLSKAALLSYWLESHGDEAAFSLHKRDVEGEFRKLALALGFDVMPRVEVAA